MAGSILNALGNATTALATVGGINQPGTLAAPSTIVSNIAIPGIPLISFRDVFLTSLETWVATVPLKSQFIAIIQSFPENLKQSVIQDLETVDGAKRGWSIDNAKVALANYAFQNTVGCIFLDGASIPDDTLSVESATISNNGGLVQGTIGSTRNAFAYNQLTLRFRETNTSFIDMILRPWVILAAHSGLVYRGDVGTSESIKTNISIFQYSRTYQNISQIPRKVWQYYNCVPTGVSTRNLVYEEDQGYDRFDVPFAYDYYTVEDNLYIPLPDIISAIGKGNIPRISPFQR